MTKLYGILVGIQLPRELERLKLLWQTRDTTQVFMLQRQLKVLLILC